MTLIFSGNDFKYELESVVKLFIPATLFDIFYEVKTEHFSGDFCFIRRKKGKQKTYLYTVCRIGERINYKINSILNSADNYEGDCEIILARLLFMCLTELTGKSAKWGILTGIRPVKRVNKMLDMGMSKEAIEKELSERFLCEKSKIDLAYKTALTQKRALENKSSKSFSLYISIPFCPSRCSYCSFVSQSAESSIRLIPEYVDRLCDEIVYTADVISSKGLRLDTIYFGGGTPTSLDAHQLKKIMKTISRNFDLSFLREYTVEAGRADTITREKLEVIKTFGADRVSINPQTMNDSVLEAIGRRHTVKQFVESFKLAKEIGFNIINTDLIAGLPTDTVESFKKTIDEIIALAPENVTVHTLSIKRAADLNRRSDTVIDNPAEQMVDYALKRLSESGYDPYYLYRQKNMLENLENIGWSKPGKESLYNIYIMEENQSIIALGAGASTKLVASDGHLKRIFNYKFPLEYIKHFDIMLEKKNEAKEFIEKNILDSEWNYEKK